MKPHPKVLIVDDELAVRRLLRVALENENYRVFEAKDGQSGSRLAVETRLDVIILDLGLPDVSGTVWLQTLREWNQTPVLVLSASNDTADQVAALDAGANDYVVKPFDAAELLARLRVLQRCIPGIPEGPFLIEGGIKVDIASHEVTVDGRPVKFTATEEAIFYLLVRHVGKVITNAHLLRSIWGNDSEKKLHELQVLIARVRKKLEAETDRVLIRTEGRIGYQLLIDSERPMARRLRKSETLDSLDAPDRFITF